MYKRQVLYSSSEGHESMMAWRCLWALTLLTVCCIASVSSECVKQGDDFSKYNDGHKYSKSDVEKNWGKTNGPYKMISGGDGGPSLTTIDGGAIRGSFRKGVQYLTLGGSSRCSTRG